MPRKMLIAQRGKGSKAKPCQEAAEKTDANNSCNSTSQETSGTRNIRPNTKTITRPPRPRSTHPEAELDGPADLRERERIALNKRVTAQKLRRAIMSDEQRNAVRTRNTNAQKLRLAKMSDEQRTALRTRNANAQKLRRAKMSDEHRNALRTRNTNAQRLQRVEMSDERRGALRTRDANAKKCSLVKLSVEQRCNRRELHAAAERARSAKVTRRSRPRSEMTQQDLEHAQERDREQRQLRLQRQMRETHCIALANHNEIQEFQILEHDCEGFNHLCRHCHAFNFAGEQKSNAEYNCCNNGRVKLDPPRYPDRFIKLLTGQEPESKNFLENIRKFNSALACASMGAQIRLPPGHGPYCFRIHGQVYHNSGPLHPQENNTPKFAQIYILDPDEATNQRMSILANVGCDIELMRYFSTFMHENNPYAQAYKMMFEVEQDEEQNAILEGRQPYQVTMALINNRGNDHRRYNAPRHNEVAIVFQSEDGAPPFERDFRVKLRSGHRVDRVSILHSGIDAMAYPLLLPYGEASWNTDLKQSNGKRMSQLMYYSYFLHERATFNPLFYATKLSQQYIVDAYCKIEANRLYYIESHQKNLRCENYVALQDYMENRADHLGQKVGKKVILPSSFQGSPRAMQQHYQDAMAIVRKYGKPDLFVTMTCNPNWQEIQENLKHGQRSEFRPDLVARVFNLKLNDLLDDIIKKGVLGKCIAHVYVIEFQKRGLPHAHILIVLSAEDKPKTADVIDRIVSAEIPDPDLHPRLYTAVTKHMIHGPCGSLNLGCPCMADGKCTKEYPKTFNATTNPNVNGYPVYKRTDTGKTFAVGRHQVDNKWVVPYNPYLLLKYNCHINTEICASIKSIKYLFKYVYKGHDCAEVAIGSNKGATLDINEPQQHLDSRYVSAPEAIWRIFAFSMHKQSHSVDRLPVHLPHEQVVYFQEGDETSHMSERDDRLTAWFKLNQEDPEAREYLYTDIPEHYTYIANSKASGRKHFWKKRQSGFNKIARMYTVPMKNEELYYLRILLLNVKGATSFDDLKTVDGEVYATFKETAGARNLLADDTEWDNAITEAALFRMPFQIREMFAFICAFCLPTNANLLWQTHKVSMTEDFVFKGLDQIQAEHQALFDIQATLIMHGKLLKDFQLPEPPSNVQHISFDREVNVEESRRISSEKVDMLNPLQKAAFDKIMYAVQNENARERLFFLDGPGGSGKTFTYETVYHSVVGLHLKIKCCASTGIAGTLLPLGSTYHSLFKLPVPLLDSSTSSIRPNSQAGQLLRDTKIILWDECTMTPHYALKAVDILLRDLMNNNRPFGGKVMLLGGDFRQIPPVVKRGNRVKVVQASLKTGKLWRLFTTLNLETNMRLAPGQLEHQTWLLQMGNGTLTNNASLGEGVIEIPSHMIEKGNLVTTIFGTSIKVKDVKKHFSNKAILCPTNLDVNRLNAEVLGLLEGESKTYSSVDSVVTDSEEERSNYPVELLHSMTPSGMPQHELKLKVGAIIMLLRNLNSKRGLCNGTRLIVTKLHNNFITAEVISGKAEGQTIFIPRIELSPSETDLPFQLRRRQFPVMLAFAMTINKSQGQSLDELGIYLPDPVFCHGQLYVAFSRGKNRDKIKVKVLNTLTQGTLIKGSSRVFTRNVVYEELLDTTQDTL